MSMNEWLIIGGAGTAIRKDLPLPLMTSLPSHYLLR